MERSIEIFRKQVTNSTEEWVEIDNNVIELPASTENNTSANIIVDLFVKVDGDISEEGNNTFYIVSNEEWIKVIRNRCDVRLVIPFNASTEMRCGNVAFFHNMDSDTFFYLNINQLGCEYSVNIYCNSDDIIDIQDDVKVVALGSFADSLKPDTIRFYVDCIGGRENFKIRKTKKFRLDLEKDFVLPDLYDNTFELIKFKEEDTGKIGFDLVNHGNTNCAYKIISDTEDDNPVEQKELVANDYFYLISVNHVDDIDSIDSIKIIFNTDDTVITDKPIRKIGINAGPREPISDFSSNENNNGLYEEFEPSMTCDVSNLTFGPLQETKVITVETVPEDSAVFFKKAGSFIKRAIVDGHEIRITVKSNPFKAERNCLCYIVDAEYPELTIPLIIKQEGST